MTAMASQITSLNDCLVNRLFRRRSKIASKLRVTNVCEGNSPITGEFPTQRAGNAENVSIWWRHHGAVNLLHITAASSSWPHAIWGRNGRGHSSSELSCRRHPSSPSYIRPVVRGKKEPAAASPSLNPKVRHAARASLSVHLQHLMQNRIRDQSRYAPCEWETSLQCNDISHSQGAYLDWSLQKCYRKVF